MITCCLTDGDRAMVECIWEVPRSELSQDFHDLPQSYLRNDRIVLQIMPWLILSISFPSHYFKSSYNLTLYSLRYWQMTLNKSQTNKYAALSICFTFHMQKYNKSKQNLGAGGLSILKHDTSNCPGNTVASSSDSDIDHYIITKKLIDSIFNI
jgi:hypothetical protein